MGGTIHHSTAWARYIQAADRNARPRFLDWVGSDGKAAGMALAFHVRSGRAWLAPWTGRLVLDSTPAVSAGDEAALADFLKAVEGYARQAACVELTVGSSASRRGGPELEGLGFEMIARREFVLDLQRSEDELWQTLEYKRRKNIKKAARQGVSLTDLSGEGGAAELRRLQIESGQRIARRGGRDIGRKGIRAADPVLVLMESGLARLVGAVADGEVVSAGLFTCFNGLVYHMLSGHSRKGLEVQAPTLLLWETIRRYKQEGARWFNLSGCKVEAADPGSPEHGVYEYKKAFGGECVECASGRKILRPGAHWLVRVVRGLLGR
jgi:hypothetical protein